MAANAIVRAGPRADTKKVGKLQVGHGRLCIPLAVLHIKHNRQAGGGARECLHRPRPLQVGQLVTAVEAVAVRAGLGRIVFLCFCSSALHQIHEHIRYLYF